jgi:hypothetical protein
MKRNLFYAVVFAAACLAVNAVRAEADVLLVDDFSAGHSQNSLGGNTGCWNINPNDTDQYCNASYSADEKLEGKNFALKLDYNIETPFTYIKEYPNTAMNGYFTQLLGKSIQNKKFLILWVKGDKKKGFTRTISVDLKSPGQTGNYLLEGITDEWQRFVVPVWKFALSDLSNVTELTFNFNEKVTRKSGAIYLGEISFTPESGEVDATAARLKAGSRIIVDGDLSEWEKNKSVAMMVFDASKHLEIGSIKDKNFLSAQTAFAWDETYLYFAAWIREDKVICEHVDNEIYKDDCIELYLDPKNQGFAWGSPEAFQIGLAPTGPDGKPQKYSWFNSENPGDNVLLASKLVKSRKFTGYYIEAAVKWSYLGVEPRPELIIGASPAVHHVSLAGSNEGAKLNWAFSKGADKIILGKLQLAR